jgi:hypothetical protein
MRNFSLDGAGSSTTERPFFDGPSRQTRAERHLTEATGSDTTAVSVGFETVPTELLAAMRRVNTAAKSFSDDAQRRYRHGDHDGAALNRTRKEALYEVKRRLLYTLVPYVSGVEAQTIDGREYYSFRFEAADHEPYHASNRPDEGHHARWPDGRVPGLGSVALDATLLNYDYGFHTPVESFDRLCAAASIVHGHDRSDGLPGREESRWAAYEPNTDIETGYTFEDAGRLLTTLVDEGYDPASYLPRGTTFR